MNLFTENEKWRKYWENVTDPADARRQLIRLRWLDEFTFHCGPEITPQDFQAVQDQIIRGERRLAELEGDFIAPSAACPETPSPAPPQVLDLARYELAENSAAQSCVFEAPEVCA